MVLKFKPTCSSLGAERSVFLSKVVRHHSVLQQLNHTPVDYHLRVPVADRPCARINQAGQECLRSMAWLRKWLDLLGHCQRARPNRQRLKRISRQLLVPEIKALRLVAGQNIHP